MVCSDDRLAIAVAAVASKAPSWAIALFFVAWFPLNYVILCDKSREILALADEDRWYTTGNAPVDRKRHLVLTRTFDFRRWRVKR